MSNPFADNTAIQIRLLRNDDTNQDDRIAIRCKEEDYYQVYYKDATLKSQSVFCTILQKEEVEKYMENLMVLMMRDSDPFESVQISYPCYPTLLFKTEDLQKKSLRSSITEMLPILNTAAKLTA